MNWILLSSLFAHLKNFWLRTEHFSEYIIAKLNVYSFPQWLVMVILLFSSKWSAFNLQHLPWPCVLADVRAEIFWFLFLRFILAS